MWFQSAGTPADKMFVKTSADVEAGRGKRAGRRFPSQTEQLGRLVIVELAEGLRRSCSNDICHWDKGGGSGDTGKGSVSPLRGYSVYTAAHGGAGFEMATDLQEPAKTKTKKMCSYQPECQSAAGVNILIM